MRRFRATFMFRTRSDRESVRWALRALRQLLRTLREHDLEARLHVVPDGEDDD